MVNILVRKTNTRSNIINSSSFKLLSDKRQNEILTNIKASELKARQEFKKDNPNSLLDKIKKNPELMGFSVGSLFGVGSGIKITKKLSTLSFNKSSFNFLWSHKDKVFNKGAVKYDFAKKSDLITHFNKHGKEFKGAYSSPEEYLRGANFVINHGHKVRYLYKGENRIGYVRFMNNTRNISIDEIIANFSKKDLGLPREHRFGEAKFEFLALRNDGTIATYHTQAGEKFYKTINGYKKEKNINVEELSCKIM